MTSRVKLSLQEHVRKLQVRYGPYNYVGKRWYHVLSISATHVQSVIVLSYMISQVLRKILRKWWHNPVSFFVAENMTSKTQISTPLNDLQKKNLPI